MNVKIRKLNDEATMPTYAHGADEDAGMDLRSTEYVVILPGELAIVPTGLAIELPPGYEAQIRTRSGLAAKNQVFVLNSPGTIDPSYRGEIKVMLKNVGKSQFFINKGDRIAQMVVARYEAVEWEQVDELSPSKREVRGFGSTGVG